MTVDGPARPSPLPIIATWELSARELIRDTIATYAWAGDGLRTDEMVQAFCADGMLDVKGRERIKGRSAIATFIASVGGVSSVARVADSQQAPRRVARHSVTNTRFVEITPNHALVESYFTVHTEIGLDHFGRYRDNFTPVGQRWLIQHRLISTDWRSPASTMALDIT